VAHFVSRFVSPGPGAGGISTSMMLPVQVKDKQNTHRLFLDFLFRTNLMSMVS
jgi:hypothetical protein